MKLQTIGIVACKLLGMWLASQACLSFMYVGWRYDRATVFELTLILSTPVVVLAAAYFLVRHAEPIAWRLLGTEDQQSVDFPQERDFWTALGYTLLAFYLLAHAAGQLTRGLGALFLSSLAGDDERPLILWRASDGLPGIGVGVAGLLLFWHARKLQRRSRACASES